MQKEGEGEGGERWWMGEGGEADLLSRFEVGDEPVEVLD